MMFPVHSMTVPVCQTMISRLILLCGFILTLQSAALSHVTFCPGQDVTLQCQVLHDADIAAVLWTRSDLKPYVCFYRDGRCDPENQHPSYEQRVEMADQDLKDGNVSVILRNVSDGDVGTYQCHIKERRGGIIEKSKPICTIRLLAPGECDHLQPGRSLNPDPAQNGTAGNSPAESSRNRAALMLVPVVLCICVSVYLLFKCYKKQKPELEPPGWFKNVLSKVQVKSEVSKCATQVQVTNSSPPLCQDPDEYHLCLVNDDE